MRLVLLSVPFYLAYVFLGFDLFFGIDLFANLSQHMLVFYGISTAALLVIITWGVSKLHYKNITTPWVSWVFNHMTSGQLMGIAEFLNTAETAK